MKKHPYPGRRTDYHFSTDRDAAREAARLRWADPTARADFGAKLRGFHVPPEVAKAYLKQRLKLRSAKEAGRLLGLI